MTDKVIEFPKHKVVRDIPGTVIEERKRRSEQKTADAMVDEITGIMMTELDNYYIDLENKQFVKDFVMVVDALRATIYRSFGIEHHLHDFIDNNIKLIEGGESMTKEELKEKIEKVISELSIAKNVLDKEDEE